MEVAKGKLPEEEVEVQSRENRNPICKRCSKFLCVTTPKAIYYLLLYSSLEAFALNGLLVFLMNYYKDFLEFELSQAKILFHTSRFLAFAFHLPGALMADMCTGKYLIIVPVHWILALIITIFALSSYDPLGLSKKEQLYIAIGCVIAIKIYAFASASSIAFIGDQYDSHEEVVKTNVRDKMYFIWYFFINVAALLASSIIPLVRGYVRCPPQTGHCYPAVFGVCAVSALLAAIVFRSGAKFYTNLPPDKSKNCRMIKCFAWGVCEIIANDFQHRRKHWLELVDDKYNAATIEDVKALYGVGAIFSTFAIYYALYDQKNSLWQTLANHLDGRTIIGQILPDLMDAMNPFLVLMLLVLLGTIVYPFLRKFGILRTPLQRMGVGFVCVGLSYLLGGCIYYAVERDQPTYPAVGKFDVAFHNGLFCDVNVSVGNSTFVLLKYESNQLIALNSNENGVPGNLTVLEKNCSLEPIPNLNFTLNATAGFAYSVVFTMKSNDENVRFQEVLQNRTREDENHAPKIRFVYVGEDLSRKELFLGCSIKKSCFPLSDTLPECDEFQCDAYFTDCNNMNYLTEICYNNKVSSVDENGQVFNCSCDRPIQKYRFSRGGIYDVMIIDFNGKFSTAAVFATADPDSVPFLLLFPMYLFLTLGEVMSMVTAYNFAYSESPRSSKSFLIGLLYFYEAMGNFVVLGIDKLLFTIARDATQSDELHPPEVPRGSTAFFVYCTLMAVNIAYFYVLAKQYTYVNPAYRSFE